MKRRPTLVWQVFLSILTVTLLSVFATGLITRLGLSSQFETYLTHMGSGQTMQGRGMGRIILGSAEETFLSGVDQAIVISALIAIAVAAVAALLLARYLTRPLKTLTGGALQFADGEHDRRVDVDGPAEVVDLAEAFNEMADSLAEAETLRRRLVADVAHELRNPIASLRAQTEAVAEGVLELDEARSASLVADVEHLSRLVDDLQELSLAEAGRLRYDPVRFDLTQLVEREVERATRLAEAGVEVRAVGESHEVFGDEMRLDQVVRNLVSNALRHTTAGTVRAVVSPSPQTPGFVRVEVIDTGEGIPESDLPYIFERFYRVDASRTTRTGGAGIGLAIARSIVEDHGGRMFAESDPGVRTVVGFEIPSDGGPIASSD